MRPARAHRCFGLLFVAAVSRMACGIADAQEPVASTPTAEHQWLQRFVGRWKAESCTPDGGDQPAMQCTGEVTVRSLGGLWIVSEIKMTMQGQSTEAVQTIGYDPKQKQYVGTWVDGMMNHLWHYEGARDATGNKLMLVAEGPSMTDPNATTKYRDSYEFKSADEIVSTSEIQGPDGKWITFMTGRMTREKPAASD